MKKLLNVIEVEGEGLESLIGEKVVLFCLNYIYSGVLSGVNEHDVILSDAYIVYETGPLTNKEFKDAQKLPNDLYVRTSSVESYYKRG